MVIQYFIVLCIIGGVNQNKPKKLFNLFIFLDELFNIPIQGRMKKHTGDRRARMI